MNKKSVEREHSFITLFALNSYRYVTFKKHGCYLFFNENYYLHKIKTFSLRNMNWLSKWWSRF